MEFSQNPWQDVTDLILLQIFSYLDGPDLGKISSTCMKWYRVAKDESLWRKLVISKLGKVVQLREDDNVTWKSEYIRIMYKVPSVLSELISVHTNEIYHVNFSPSGRFISTTGADGQVKIWEYGYPTSLYRSWQVVETPWYANYTEFNATEDLLLVNTVLDSNPSYIPYAILVVLSVHSEDLRRVCAVHTHFTDIRGTWISQNFFIYVPDYRDDMDERADYINKFILTACKVKRFYLTEKADMPVSELCAESYHSKQRKVLLESQSIYSDYQMLKIVDSSVLSASSLMSCNVPTSSHTQQDTHTLLPKCFYESEFSEQNYEKVAIVFHCGPLAKSESFCVALYKISMNKSYVNAMPMKVINIKQECIGVCLSNDHRLLAYNMREFKHMQDESELSTDINLVVLDISTGVCLSTSNGHLSQFENYSFFIFPSISKTFLASGSEEGDICIWDNFYNVGLERLRHMYNILPKQSCVNAVAFHPFDQEVLVSVADDFKIKIWRSKNRIKTINQSSEL